MVTRLHPAGMVARLLHQGLMMTLAALPLLAGGCAARGDLAIDEPERKAAYLVSFSHFTDWPGRSVRR